MFRLVYIILQNIYFINFFLFVFFIFLFFFSFFFFLSMLARYWGWARCALGQAAHKVRRPICNVIALVINIIFAPFPCYHLSVNKSHLLEFK